jgi:hypothetical protein
MPGGALVPFVRGGLKTGASWRSGLLLPTFVNMIAGSSVSGIISAPVPAVVSSAVISECTAATARYASASSAVRSRWPRVASASSFANAPQ